MAGQRAVAQTRNSRFFEINHGKEMKIGILTLRLHSNYGGILQAYALMTVLKRLGHEPVLIYNQSFKYRSGMGRALLY